MTRSKTEDITEILRDEILKGQYRAGERLPSERDLASRFESNRGAIREAIKKLEQLGIVQVNPGGVRVIAIEDATLEVLGHLLDLEEFPKPALVEQSLDVSAALTGLSARTAVERADADQRAEILEVIQRLQHQEIEDETYHEGWVELRNCFNKVNNNLVLRLIGNGLKNQFVGRLQNAGIRALIDLERDREFLKELEEAMNERDGEKAVRAITHHHQLIKQAILKALNQEGAILNLRSANA